MGIEPTTNGLPIKEFCCLSLCLDFLFVALPTELPLRSYLVLGERVGVEPTIQAGSLNIIAALVYI